MDPRNLLKNHPRVAGSLSKAAVFLNRVADSWGLLTPSEGDQTAGAPSGFSINHVGMAVPSIEKFLAGNAVLYKGFRQTAAVVNDRQRVREVFITDGRTVVELLEPTGPDSPLHGFLRKNAGGGLVHVCFECDDVKEGIRVVTGAGGRLITGPTPDVAFEERPIAFLMLADQVIELVQRKPANERGS